MEIALALLKSQEMFFCLNIISLKTKLSGATLQAISYRQTTQDVDLF